MRVAVIGNGSIGQRHARDLRALGQEVICYDTNPERSEVKTLDDLWNWQPQTVFICTPPESHMGLAYVAARAGCHLFVEKPLSLVAGGTALIREAARALGLVTHVACPLRYVPELQQIKREVGDARTASVVRGYNLPKLRPDYKYSYYEQTGILLEFGSHMLDLMQWFLGPGHITDRYYSQTYRVKLDTPSIVKVFADHDDDRASWFYADWTEEHPYQVDVVGASWRTWTMGDNIDGAYRAEVQHFLEACEGKHPPDNPLDEALVTFQELLKWR